MAVCAPLLAQDHFETLTRDELKGSGKVEIGPALALARPDIFDGVDSAVLIHGLPVLTLLEGRRFPFSTELGRMGMSPLDVFPVAFLSAVDVQKAGGSPRYGSDAPGGVVDLRLNRLSSGGEVGFFYGRSTGKGKYSREDYSAYFIGGMGNEKFNITAGVSYHEAEVRFPRARR